MLDPRAAVFVEARARRPLLKRGAVTATFDPMDVHWNDRPLRLSPMEATLLIGLLRRGRLRWDDIAALLEAHGACADSRDVLVHRIRRKFAATGARDPIETIRGWGLRFSAEPDRYGSTSLLIGASEPDPLEAPRPRIN